MKEFVDLKECESLDTSLDLDGKLLNENFGKGISEGYNVADLVKPLNQ